MEITGTGSRNSGMYKMAPMQTRDQIHRGHLPEALLQALQIRLKGSKLCLQEDASMKMPPGKCLWREMSGVGSNGPPASYMQQMHREPHLAVHSSTTSQS